MVAHGAPAACVEPGVGAPASRRDEVRIAQRFIAGERELEERWSPGGTTEDGRAFNRPSGTGPLKDPHIPSDKPLGYSQLPRRGKALQSFLSIPAGTAGPTGVGAAIRCSFNSKLRSLYLMKANRDPTSTDEAADPSYATRSPRAIRLQRLLSRNARRI